MDKCEEVGVDLFLFRRAHPVGAPLVDLKLRVFDDFRRKHARGLNRHDLIVIPMKDQCWYVEGFQIFGEHIWADRYDRQVNNIFPGTSVENANKSMDPFRGRLNSRRFVLGLLPS